MGAVPRKQSERCGEARDSSPIPHVIAPSYLRNIVVTFKHFFKFFHTREILDLIPGFPSVKVPRKEIRWLTVEQQAQVHEFIPTQHLPIFKFLQDYGRRPSEVCNLKREDVDWAKREIKIHNTKTGQIDCLPIGIEFEKWLVGGLKSHEVNQQWLNALGGQAAGPRRVENDCPKRELGEGTPGVGDGIAKTAALIRNTQKSESNVAKVPYPLTNLTYIFLTQTGKPYTRQTLYGIWTRGNELANEWYGTPIVSNYEGNRKSFGSQRIGKYDLSLIAACMGHASVKTTEYYYGKMETQKLGEVVEMGRK